MTDSIADARDKERAAALCQWMSKNSRDLPWRRRRSPYAALVSEAMLQQTQVSRVIDRFNEFMTSFPDVGTLADATEQNVLAHWQGLGYYRRARHLHQAAKTIVNEHDGVIPGDATALRKLPGVGRYTAAAIASIIHNLREPLVDGNVQRVLARWNAHEGSPSGKDHQAWCWSRATSLVNITSSPSVFNEGMMELGALVCTPAQPLCDCCPVRALCDARQQQRQHEIPLPKQKTKRRTEHHHLLIARRDNRVLLEQRSDKGMWANMWQPPAIVGEEAYSIDLLHERSEMTCSRMEHVESFLHNTTHRAVYFHVYLIATRQRRGAWVNCSELAHLPMSNAHRRALTITGIHIADGSGQALSAVEA